MKVADRAPLDPKPSALEWGEGDVTRGSSQALQQPDGGDGVVFVTRGAVMPLNIPTHQQQQSDQVCTQTSMYLIFFPYLHMVPPFLPKDDATPFSPHLHMFLS